MRLLAILLGVALNFAAMAAQSSLPHPLTGDEAALLWPPSLFVAVLIHEVGHALMAMALKGDVKVLAVFDYGYDFRTKRFGRQRAEHLREIAGFVTYTLRNNGQTRFRRAAIALAGPMANAVLTLSILLLIRGAYADKSQAILFSIAAQSAIAAVANLVPFQGSDGWRIWRLCRSPIL